MDYIPDDGCDCEGECHYCDEYGCQQCLALSKKAVEEDEWDEVWLDN